MIGMNLNVPAAAPPSVMSGMMRLFLAVGLLFIAVGLLLAFRFGIGLIALYWMSTHIEALPFANSWLGVAIGALLLPLFLQYGWRLLWPGKMTTLPAIAVAAVIVTVALSGFVSEAGQNFDKNGKPLRFVAFTPEKPVFSNQPGFDSTYRMPFQPLTRELAMEIRALQMRGFFEADPVQSHWFGAAENPLLWYARSKDGWKFYSQPGTDRAIGVRLMPVTPEVRRQWEEWRQNQTKT